MQKQGFMKFGPVPLYFSLARTNATSTRPTAREVSLDALDRARYGETGIPTFYNSITGRATASDGWNVGDNVVNSSLTSSTANKPFRIGQTVSTSLSQNASGSVDQIWVDTWNSSTWFNLSNPIVDEITDVVVQAENTIVGVNGDDFEPLSSATDTANRSSFAWFDYFASRSNSSSPTVARPVSAQYVTAGAIQRS